MAAVDQSTNLDEKSRRVRNLLSSYYGVDGAPSQGGSPRSEQSDTPSARSTSRLGGSRALAGLDSAAFDVERYISCSGRLSASRKHCPVTLSASPIWDVLEYISCIQAEELMYAMQVLAASAADSKA